MIDCPHRLLFIRHGETDWNREGRLQGQRDIPLNPRGREQAAAVGRSLRRLMGEEIDRLEAAGAFFSSPLLRTRQTMEIAREAMGLPARGYALDDNLKELTFGEWEGLTWPEVRAVNPAGAAARHAGKWAYSPPGGESYAELAERLAPWVASVTRDLFVCSHGGVARALMYLLADVKPEVAAEVDIHQGRGIVFEDARFRWVG